MSASADPRVRGLIAGVIWPGFDGTVPPDWLRRELEAGLAGVVYFAQNIDSDDPGRLRALAARLREARGEVLIGMDEEGGPVTRLEAARGSTLPSAAQLGRLDEPTVTAAAGEQLGLRARVAGVNVLLAPVADVNTNPRNPVIGTRSFGSAAGLVSRHVVAAVAGIQGAGVAACVKHFPGHGDTISDSHLALPTVELPLAEVEAEHLPPFQAAVEAGVAAVMTSHVAVRALGSLPATLDRGVIGLLREAGFDGVVVSDALDMAAIADGVGMGPGAVRALLAGVDLLCVGNPSGHLRPWRVDGDREDYTVVRDALAAAVDDGTLPIAVLERANRAVAGMAARYPSVADAPEAGPFDADAVVAAAIEIRGALPELDGDRLVIDLRERGSGAIAPGGEPFSAELHARLVVAGPVGSRDPAALVAEALAGSTADQPVIALVDAVQPGSQQCRVLELLGAVRRRAIAVNTGLPAPAVLAIPHIETLGSSRVTARVVAGVLGVRALDT